MFRFFCFSLCYVLNTFFITVVDNATSNAQPLSPPIFEKIAPHLKQNVISSSAFPLLHFFNFYNIFIDFRVPLSPLGQIGPMIDLGPIFVRFCKKLSNDEGGNGKTTRPFDQSFPFTLLLGCHVFYNPCSSSSNVCPATKRRLPTVHLS